MKISSVYQNNNYYKSLSSQQPMKKLSFSSSNNKGCSLPDIDGKTLLYRRDAKRGFPIVVGTSTSTGEKIIINFDEKYIQQILILFSKEGVELTAKNLLNPNNCLKNPILKKLPKEANEFLSDLKEKDFQKYEMVHSVLELTELRTKTIEGVSDEYLTKFVEKLADTHSVLLKNVIDNKIPIRIHDVLAAFDYKVGHARYGNGNKALEARPFDELYCVNRKFDENKKFIEFTERDYNGPITSGGVVVATYNSIPHEFAHAFDYSNGQKLNFTKQDAPTIDLPQKNSIGENYSRFLDNPSFSKEFDEALSLDIVNLSKIDEVQGKEEGTTFRELLTTREFISYMGAHKTQLNKRNILFNDLIMRREMFAEVFSYVAQGTFNNDKKQNVWNKYFPNTIECAKYILEQAEKNI